jgi:nucleoid-associated protein EbfC
MANPFDLSNLGDIVKQAKAMQDRLAALQEEAGKRSVEASSGGGMVTVRVNGKLQILALRIDPEIVRGGDVELVQDLVLAAVNEGIRAAQKMMADEMQQLTGGLKIPGLG